MNKNLLIYHIKQKGEKIEDLAAVLGIHPMTLREKINGKSEFRQSEIDVIARRYNLTPDEAFKVFFTEATK